MSRKRKIKTILIILLSTSLLITGLYFFVFRETGITGREWFLQQDERVEDLSLLYKEIDDVFILYIGGYMSQEDFKNEEILLRQQFSIVKAKYEQLDSNKNIKTGTHDWISKKGEDIFQEMFADTEYFLSQEYAEMDKESITANYLVFRDEMKDSLSGYITLHIMINEENKDKKGE